MRLSLEDLHLPGTVLYLECLNKTLCNLAWKHISLCYCSPSLLCILKPQANLIMHGSHSIITKENTILAI